MGSCPRDWTQLNLHKTKDGSGFKKGFLDEITFSWREWINYKRAVGCNVTTCGVHVSRDKDMNVTATLPWVASTWCWSLSPLGDGPPPGGRCHQFGIRGDASGCQWVTVTQLIPELVWAVVTAWLCRCVWFTCGCPQYRLWVNHWCLVPLSRWKQHLLFTGQWN